MERKREAEKYREKNNVKKIRESQLMSKAELARRASVSVKDRW
jgi:DNA-binding transcriptional regulator YiaG